MEALGPQKRRRRVVLVPYPYQGHVTPMLQLASTLHSKGFSIAIAHTEFNAPNPSNYPDFTFLLLPDNLGDYDTSFNNILNVILAMNENCKAPFQECMDKMIDEEEEVACIIYDSIMQFVDGVANDLKIPTIVLRTNTAAYIQSHTVLFELISDKVIPIPESKLHEPVPKLNPLRYKDLPLPATIEFPESVLDFTKSYMNIRSSSAVIWNSPHILEHTKLHQLHEQQQWQVPFFPIGPLHKMAPALSTTSLMKEDSTCLSWLDKHAANSVIYVSLGSLAVIDKKELNEMAWGLARSEQPFLWVVRPSLLNESEAIEFLPKEFFDVVKDRGCVVKWAPQKKILAHSSVGGFLSHCGWNSTMESLSEGVPMICKPCFSDQMVNARYVSHVWRVGIELEEEMCIEKAVRKLMVGEEGKEIRKRAVELKKELEDSVKEGGYSCKSVDELVEFIISLSRKK